jgi:ComF family protein
VKDSRLQRWGDVLLDILFPPACHLCRQPVSGGIPIHICPACRESLHRVVSPLCSHCGQPFVSSNQEDHRCGDCITSPPPFAVARSAYRYEAGMHDLIHQFKYGKRVRLRRPLALLLAEQLTPFVRDAAPDLLLPVPLHVQRLRRRGFNQVVLLADLLSEFWGIPHCRDALRRLRPTGEQATLDALARARNVRGAFEVARSGEVKGRRILLLDDVYTTGSTVRECARVLRKAGSGEVFVATVARAM